MSGNALVVPSMLGAIVGFVFIYWINLRLVKSKIGRWNSYSTVLFILSVTGYGARRREMWRRQGGYNEEEIKVITRHQVWCLFELPLVFSASAVLTGMLLS